MEAIGLVESLKDMRKNKGFEVNIDRIDLNYQAITTLLGCKLADKAEYKSSLFLALVQAYINEADAEQLLATYGLLEGYNYKSEGLQAGKRRIRYYERTTATDCSHLSEKEIKALQDTMRTQEDGIIERFADKIIAIDVKSDKVTSVLEGARKEFREAGGLLLLPPQRILRLSAAAVSNASNPSHENTYAARVAYVAEDISTVSHATDPIPPDRSLSVQWKKTVLILGLILASVGFSVGAVWLYRTNNSEIEIPFSPFFDTHRLDSPGPGSTSFWGPNRQTHTVRHQADFITFNSITDNPFVGDERSFIGVREAGAENPWLRDIEIHPDREYEVLIYVHNNASDNLEDSIARNVRVYINIQYADQRAHMEAIIEASNSIPEQVWSVANMWADSNFSINIIHDSVKWYNVNFPEGIEISGSGLAWGGGLILGYDVIDSIIPGSGLQVGGLATYNMLNGNIPGGGIQSGGFLTFGFIPCFLPESD